MNHILPWCYQCYSQQNCIYAVVKDCFAFVTGIMLFWTHFMIILRDSY